MFPHMEIRLQMGSVKMYGFLNVSACLVWPLTLHSCQSNPSCFCTSSLIAIDQYFLLFQHQPELMWNLKHSRHVKLLILWTKSQFWTNQLYNLLLTLKTDCIKNLSFFFFGGVLHMWVTKLLHFHISLWDDPIMFPFSFCLLFIASNHFYSLPPTPCSTYTVTLPL